MINKVSSQDIKKWDELPSRLEKLFFLRKWANELHRHRSKAMATGNIKDTQELLELEKKITTLRKEADLNQPLKTLLNMEHINKNSQQDPIPVIPEKLGRYDRIWEQSLALEAFKLGWQLWVLESSLKISDTEAWHESLSQTLYPHGICLFSESAGLPSDFWQARVYIVLSPKFNTKNLNLSNLPGHVEDPTKPIQWKILYSPSVF